MVALLALNELAPDESTSRDGNCGVSAFVISLMAQMQGQHPRGAKPGLAEGRRQQSLKRCPVGQRVTQARAAAVEWVGENPRTKVWDGMILSMLCRAVAGEDHQQYVQRMRRNGEWADTVFLHALGNVYGANVVVFQAGTDPALLGPCLHEDLGSTGAHLMVPVALVNDYHFWGVVPCVSFWSQSQLTRVNSSHS